MALTEVNSLGIKDGEVKTADIAADAVTGAKIADDAINSEHYTDGSIDTAHIADLNVTTAKIAADAITGAKIADDAIDSEHIADGSIDTAHIAADQITAAKIADDAVGAEHIEQLDADLSFADNAKAKFGAGNDLEIYHSGSGSYIADTGTGPLILKASEISFTNAGESEHLARFYEDGAAVLLHNGTNRVTTTASGATIDGSIQIPCDGTLANRNIAFERANGTGDYSTFFGVTNYPDESAYDDQDDGYWANISAKGGCVMVINSDGTHDAGRNNHDHFSVYQKAGTEVSNAGRRLFSVDNVGGVQFGLAGIRIDNAWEGQPSLTVQRNNNAGTDNTDNSAYLRVHGIGETHASWTGAESPGNDFAANFLIDGSTYGTSDRRAKTDIVDCPYGLDVVNKLQPRKYQLVNSQLEAQGDDNINLGFIAQEIKEHIPECVNYLGDEADKPNEKGYAKAYALDIGEVVPVLVKAIQELSAKVTALEAG